MAGWIKMSIGRDVGLGQGHIVLDGTQLPLKGHNNPVHVYRDQTAGWINIPLGTEVGFGPGDIVLDGDPAPRRKWTQQPPLFCRCLLWPNCRTSQQLLSYNC